MTRALALYGVSSKLAFSRKRTPYGGALALELDGPPGVRRRMHVDSGFHVVVRENEAKRVRHLARGDFVRRRQQRGYRQACGVGGCALFAAQRIAVLLGQVPYERAQSGEIAARRRRVVQLVELLLGVFDDEHMTVIVRGVAAVVGASLRVAVDGQRHLQRHRIAVGTAEAVASRRSGDGAARRRGICVQKRNREVDLQLVAVAPATEAVERGDDRARTGMKAPARRHRYSREAASRKVRQDERRS